MLSLRRDQRGIVGFNLAVTIAFALFAVIELSRVTLAAKQIDDRVKVITAEVGPGSNVSRLDETQKLNDIGRKAEEILAAAKPLSPQAGVIVDTVRSIDGTVSNILRNASEINTTVRSINGTATALLPVVRNINGDGTISATTGGVDAINKRADLALRPDRVPGIRDDLNRVSVIVGAGGVPGHTGQFAGSIHSHVNSINCAPVLGAAGCGT
ncbi:MAG: hypothetical protein ACRD1K_03125 [Acidimicrobiales bacterium]